MGPTRRQVLATTAPVLAGVGGTTRRRPKRSCPPTIGGSADARIGFTGDVMLGRYVNDRWSDPDRDPVGVWGSTIDRCRALDGLVINLECCLSARGERTPDRTYYFRADPSWAVPALGTAGVACASLANNHLLDFGPTALADTRTALADAAVARPGAGPDRETAREPAIVDAGGVDVGVLAFTDQSPSYAAGPDDPGTAYLTLDHRRAGTRRAVRSSLRTLADRGADLVVASLHWGPNWEVRPSAQQRRFARWLVDEGVDVVHGHSAHVVQGVEVYRGRPILYDCGDFVDDYVVKDDLHNDRSFLFELRIADGRLRGLDLVPVEIAEYRVNRAPSEAADWLRDRMRTLSEPFGTAVRRRGDGLTIPLGEC